MLMDEQSSYNDLIVDSYEEGYYKLAGKVLRALKWYIGVYDDHNSPRFFMKTDHDVFINLPNLVKALKNTSYYRNLEDLSKSVVEHKIADSVNIEFSNSKPDSYFVGGRRQINPPIIFDNRSK